MRLIRPAVLVLASATLLAVPATGHAATIKACQNKQSGKLRIAKMCKKSEKRISWNTTGPKGAAGAPGAAGGKGANGTNGAPGTNGANGTNGAPGQPQAIRRFSASQTGGATGTNVALFAVDGESYSFHCQNAIILNVAQLLVDGSGTAYSQGTLSRPTGVTRQDGDPWSSTKLTTLGGGAKSIAEHTTLSQVDSNPEQDGVYTSVVEGPTATTLLNYKMVAAGPCTIQGVAITIPNAS